MGAEDIPERMFQMFPTKSAFKPAPRARSFIVGRDTSVHEIADRARRAALEFMGGTNAGWGEREIGEWLIASYGAATRATKSRIAAVGRPSSEESAAGEESLVPLLLRTRDRLTSALRTCRKDWTDSAFAREMIDGGFVAGVADDFGAIGFAPVDAPGMRLFDRVISLFIADFLTRPNDYARLELCDDCGEVSFEWAPSHLSGCEGRGRHSEVVPRHGMICRTYRGVGT